LGPGTQLGELTVLPRTSYLDYGGLLLRGWEEERERPPDSGTLFLEKNCWIKPWLISYHSIDEVPRSYGDNWRLTV